MTAELVKHRPHLLPADVDEAPANPFTDLHCPNCGEGFPGTVEAADGEGMESRCCGELVCFGADDGDCGCLVTCYRCPRQLLKVDAWRTREGNPLCGGCWRGPERVGRVGGGRPVLVGRVEP
ncbi:hypothetical protein ABT352_33085 [Streptosporangium sp. NPDC000563]|uniref:hypothetical protein n=1 Tax=Streptosporangium sp. NPDC000563 TaxID=3154366 RepID=UPI0033300B53